MDNSPRQIEKRLPDIAEGVIGLLIPRSIRQDLLEDFREGFEEMPLAAFVKDAAGKLCREIREQLRAAVDYRLGAAQVCAMYLAFAEAAVSPKTLVFIAVGLAILVLRHYYRYPANASPQETAVDSLLAVTFGVAAHRLASTVVPALTLPPEIIIRGIIACPILLCTLQTMFSSAGLKDSYTVLVESYHSTSSLNLLWLITFVGLIMANAEVMPGDFRGRGLVLTSTPIIVFSVVFRAQAAMPSPVWPANSYRDELMRMRCRLWGSDESKSRAWQTGALIAALGPLGLSMAATVCIAFLRPDSDVHWDHIGENFGAFVVFVLVTLYVRRSNRITLSVIQQEIETVAVEKC